jgi:hypothetical protein
VIRRECIAGWRWGGLAVRVNPCLHCGHRARAMLLVRPQRRGGHHETHEREQCHQGTGDAQHALKIPTGPRGATSDGAAVVKGGPGNANERRLRSAGAVHGRQDRQLAVNVNSMPPCPAVSVQPLPIIVPL